MAGLRSLRSTWIAYGATALAVIAFNAGTAYDTYGSWPERSAADRAGFVRAGIPLQEAFMANAAMVMVLALGAIGAVAIIGEYSTGTIRTRFAAVPARRSVMAAKTVVVTAVTTVFGAIVAGTSFGLTAILDGRDAGVSISYPGALRVVVASARLAPVCTVAGTAIGSVIRQTSASMIASVVVILVLPIAFTDGSH
ncbi:ABC transporter permease subunit [Streptomyces goshikiensis]|uniref:ABC transporter permease subunit n=1 Tax=Streptomyces goshikiensis TaxID=1942 RepID=UPI0036AD3AC6